MRTIELIRADTYRQFGKTDWHSIIKGLIIRRTFRVIVTMRLCQYVARSRGLLRLSLPCLKVIHRLACHWAAMDLPWSAAIGDGLAITHGWGLVVTGGARIGSNVTLFHGVTIGRRDRISRDGARTTGYPILEDEVWVGPHAIIVGGITIGRGSRIAGGSFVTESVPPHSTVSGNPAKIIRTDCVANVMNPAPLRAE